MGNSSQLPKRINNDLGLLIKDSSDHILFTPDSRFNFGAGGFSAIIQIHIVKTTNIDAYFWQYASGGYNMWFRSDSTISANFQTPLGSHLLNTGITPELKQNVSCAILSYDGTNIKLFYNGKKIQEVADSNAGQSIDLTAGNHVLGNRTAFTQSAQGACSNIAFINKGLTDSEARLISLNGGAIPSSLHTKIINHWPLTQKSYFKADAAFIAKYPAFALNDLVAWDVVEQYNYINPYSFDTTNFNTWSLSANMTVNGGGNELTYDGLGAGNRGGNEGIQGATIGDYIIVEFEVLSLGGAAQGLFVAIGGTTTNTYYVEINSIGIHRVYLYYESGGPTFFFSNSNKTASIDYKTTSWTVTMPTIGIKKPTHGKLIGFTDDEILNSNQAIYSTKGKSYAFTKGLQLDGVSFLRFTNDSFNIAANEDFSIEWLESGESLTSECPWSTMDNGLVSGLYILQVGKDISLIVNFSNTNATGFHFVLPQGTSKPRQVIFTVDNNNTEVIDQNGTVTGNLTPTSIVRCRVDGVEYVTSRIHGRNGTGVSATYFYDGTDAINGSPLLLGARQDTGVNEVTKALYSWLFYRKKLTSEDLINRYRGRYYYPLDLDADIEDAFAFVSKNMVSLKQSDVIAINTGMGSDVYLKEAESGLPEIKEALQFSANSIEINSLPASTIGYTFVFMLAHDNPTLTPDAEWLRINQFTNPRIAIRNNNVNDIIKVDVENGGGLVNHLPSPLPCGLEGLYDQLSFYAVRNDGNRAIKDDKFLNYNGVHIPNGGATAVTMADYGGLTAFLFARFSTNTFPLDAKVAGFMMFTKRLSDKELSKLNNNNLFNLSERPAIHYSFNSEAFSENGSNVIIKNYGTTGATNDGIVRGFTGGTSADQLADLLTNIVSIDSLR